MKIGFTGTRQALQHSQAMTLENIIIFNKKSLEELHHGDCVGADAYAHAICVAHGVETIVHPPDKEIYRAHCVVMKGTVLKPKPYLERDKDIVDQSDFLLAAPKEYVEIRRSGTWATVRMALKQGKTVFIVYPSGGLKRRTV